ncbi:MAG: hypothetical protein OXH52_19325 [Gammaproteobacteria bacterium]|nr:hypothetical protein [Gammaproteobacteria bacterium]
MDAGAAPVAIIRAEVCSLERLRPEELAAIRREIKALRQHYKHPDSGGWRYGENRHRLVAYALAYYPCQVELFGEAIQEAFDGFRVPRKWDLTPKDGLLGARYAIVGCGAGPELYGLLRYVANCLYASGHREDVVPDIRITLFEPELECWSCLFEAVTKPLIQRGQWLAEQMGAGRIRIEWSREREPIPEMNIQGKYDLVIVQHVLNELNERIWSGWLQRVMRDNVRSRGIICVIDPERDVHSELRSLGFDRSVKLDFRWSENGARKLDPVATKLLFTGESGLIERLNVRATALFWEKTTAVRVGPRLPPSRVPRPSLVPRASGNYRGRRS